jgi:putative ABC transport system permease protein
VIGALASLVGVAVGVGLAVGLRALLGKFDFSFPATSLVVSRSTLLVGFAIGVVVTVFAGLLPAARATRISPVAAVREGVTRERGRMARVATVLGAVLLALGTGLLALGMLKGGDLGVAGTLASSLGGMLILFIGAAMLVPVAVPLVARFVGWPAARFAGIPGRLARDNAIRNPGRTASTAAALMIGIALVSAIAVVGRSLKISAVEATESQIAASHVLQSQTGWESLPPEAARTLVGAPGVRALSSVRYDRGKIGKKQVDVSGIDPATIDGPYRFTWKQGTSRALATLGTTGALVRDDLAKQKHLAPGDTISVESASGKTTDYVVRGIIAPAKLDSLLGHVIVTQAAFDATFPQPADEFTFVDLEPGTDTEALAARLKVFPDATLRTTPAMIAKRQGDIDSLVALLTMLLVLAVITALLGMVNALALAVIERTRDRGLARGRDDPPPDAADGAARGGDDVPDRSRRRTAARDPCRRGRDPGALEVRCRIPPAGEAARGVRRGRGDSGSAGSGTAGAPGGKARRAAGAAVRVEPRWGATGRALAPAP